MMTESRIFSSAKGGGGVDERLKRHQSISRKTTVTLVKINIILSFFFFFWFCERVVAGAEGNQWVLLFFLHRKQKNRLIMFSRETHEWYDWIRACAECVTNVCTMVDRTACAWHGALPMREIETVRYGNNMLERENELETTFHSFSFYYCGSDTSRKLILIVGIYSS